jgi:hypothetical protein
MKAMTARVRAVLLLWPLLAGLAACSVVQARTPAPVPPPLNAPDPPARILVPPVESPAPPPAAPGAASAPGRVTPATPPPSRPPDRSAATQPPPPPPPDAPAPILQTTPNVIEVERKIQDSLNNAKGDLLKVVVVGLGPAAKAQYDLAGSLIRAATEQLTLKNYSLAEQLAGKAALLASQLVKR